MRSIVGLGQVLPIEPRVNLSGRDVRVSKQLLHTPQVTARLQQMRREAMSQYVRMHVDAQSEFSG